MKLFCVYQLPIFAVGLVLVITEAYIFAKRFILDVWQGSEYAFD